MSEEEIHKALEIIKQPITVNCKDYYYFDQENYNNLVRIYDNCLWFIRNFEQINFTVERLQQENRQLKEQLENASKNYTKYIQQRDNVLDEIREYIENNSLYEEEYDYDYEETMYLSGISDEKAKEDLLQILDKVKE